MSNPLPADLEFIICNKSSSLPDFVWLELQQHEVDANVVLPVLNKCRSRERKGVIAQDHLWIVAFVRTPVCTVKLILACTDGLTGKYPLFLFTPLPCAAMKDDPYIFHSLTSAARHLQTRLPTHRIYSVFGRDLLSRTFATIWTQQTNIPLILEPYYHCKITYLTPTALELNRRELPSIPMAQIRPAETRDWEGVTKLCHGFADTSVCHLSFCNFFSYSIILVAPIYYDGRRSRCRSPRAHSKQNRLGFHFGTSCRLACCLYSQQ